MSIPYLKGQQREHLVYEVIARIVRGTGERLGDLFASNIALAIFELSSVDWHIFSALVMPDPIFPFTAAEYPVLSIGIFRRAILLTLLTESYFNWVGDMLGISFDDNGYAVFILNGPEWLYSLENSHVAAFHHYR